MKKNLFILAAAALALASCSSDETTATNQSLQDANEISFRAFTNKVTRAADINQAWLEGAGNGFRVTALYNASASQEGGTEYFGGTTPVHYTFTNGYYTSTDKYYWPGGGYLNFYAFAPATGTDVARTAYNTFTVTPNNTAASQQDFVYAVAYDQTKGSNGAGVNLTFHHAESKISIQAKNSSSMTFTLGTVTLCQVSTTGTFTYTSAATNISSGKLTACWSAQSGSSSYQHTPNTTSFAAGAGASAIATDMILIPQTIAPVTAYSSASQDVGLATTGSFIKVQLKAQQAGQYVLGGVSTWAEAIWPLPSGSWDPGYHYTYTIDLAGGGYSATNKDTDTDLDPLLEGAEIKFVGVTVDAWDDGGNTTLGNITVAKGGTYSENIVTTSGVYYITVTGLTAGNTVSVTGTVNCTSPSVLPATVGASGSVTITCPVTAGTSATSVITLTETGSPGSTTTINLVQP